MANTATRQTRLERLCAEKGMRMTGQRRIIARVLSEAEDHPDVEEVHATKRRGTVTTTISSMSPPERSSNFRIPRSNAYRKLSPASLASI